MLPNIFLVEEVFWSLEDEGGDAANIDSNTSSLTFHPSPQQSEYIIHGSPLWLIAGIALGLVLIVSVSNDPKETCSHGDDGLKVRHDDNNLAQHSNTTSNPVQSGFPWR